MFSLAPRISHTSACIACTIFLWVIKDIGVSWRCIEYDITSKNVTDFNNCLTSAGARHTCSLSRKCSSSVWKLWVSELLRTAYQTKALLEQILFQLKMLSGLAYWISVLKSSICCEGHVRLRMEVDSQSEIWMSRDSLPFPFYPNLNSESSPSFSQ